MPKQRKQKQEEPNDEFIKLSAADLTTQLTQFKDKCNDLKTKRNYIQMDRDMVEQYFKNTQNEIFSIKTEIKNRQTEANSLEKDHNIEVKLYLQRVKHLEFEQQRSNLEIENDGQNAKNKQNQYFENKLAIENNEKQKFKKKLMKQQNKYIDDVDFIQSHHESKQQLLKDNYARQLEQIQAKFQHKLVELKQELDLKLKVEIHEVEQRKNLHINELMKNHDEAFRQLKAYYNDITSDNLKLIRENKAEIKRLTEASIANKKLIADIKSENNSLQGPLEQQIKRRDYLKYMLRQFLKHKMSLVNYKSKYNILKQNTTKLQNQSICLGERLDKLDESKNDLEHKFDVIAQEVKHNANGTNKALNERLFAMIDCLDEKEGQLQQVIHQASLQMRIVDQISYKIQDTVKEKNDFIKSLKYSVEHATKAYNDAIRVYEAKLVQFGIPSEQLGFQPLASLTSTMPAGLVAS